MKHDYFAHKAHRYEKNERTVGTVDEIAKAVCDTVVLRDDMHIMDVGSGTGLLLERIAPRVAKVTAVDISNSMNAQLQAKSDKAGWDLEIIEADLAQTDLPQRFDGIISSMTMHHIEDTAAMFARFHGLLNEGGFIAIADLDAEDGTFHTEDTGIFHFGFDRREFVALAEGAGFQRAATTDASVYRREQSDYPLFLLTAYK